MSNASLPPLISSFCSTAVISSRTFLSEDIRFERQVIKICNILYLCLIDCEGNKKKTHKNVQANKMSLEESIKRFRIRNVAGYLAGSYEHVLICSDKRLLLKTPTSQKSTREPIAFILAF